MFAIWHTVPVDKIEDARTHELVVGAPGSNSSPAFYGRLFRAVFDIKIKILAGYPGAAEALLAMERGENDGNSSAYWSSLKAVRPDWIAEKKLKFLVQYGPHPHPELAGVPFALDLLKDPVKHEMMAVASAPLVMGTTDRRSSWCARRSDRGVAHGAGRNLQGCGLSGGMRHAAPGMR